MSLHFALIGAGTPSYTSPIPMDVKDTPFYDKVRKKKTLNAYHGGIFSTCLREEVGYLY